MRSKTAKNYGRNLLNKKSKGVKETNLNEFLVAMCVNFFITIKCLEFNIINRLIEPI